MESFRAFQNLKGEHSVEGVPASLLPNQKCPRSFEVSAHLQKRIVRNLSMLWYEWIGN